MSRVGIEAYACTFPHWRVRRDTVREAGWPVPSGWSWSSVAGPDDDALTLALAASSRVCERWPASTIESIGIASTSLPYSRRVQGAIVVEALGLDRGVLLTEHTTSSRAATEALLLHASHVDAGGGDALVVACEAPGGTPPRLDESASAVALLMRRSGSVATIDGTASRCGEYPGLDFVVAGEALAVRDISVPDYASEAYCALLTGAVSGVLSQCDAELHLFRYVVLGGVDLSLAAKGARELGLAPEQWKAVAPYGAIGEARSVGAMFGLVAALDSAEEGERVLVTSYGGGSALDAIALTAGPGAGLGLVPGWSEHLVDIDFARYLRLRGGE